MENLSDIIPSASAVKDYIVDQFPRKEWAERAEYARHLFQDIGYLDNVPERDRQVLWKKAAIMLGFKWGCEELISQHWPE